MAGPLTGATSSVVDLFHATVALPDSLSLKNLTLPGPGNQLQDGATFTAASGSTANLGSASVVRASPEAT